MKTAQVLAGGSVAVLAAIGLVAVAGPAMAAAYVVTIGVIAVCVGALLVLSIAA